jgi:hypothetical protein
MVLLMQEAKQRAFAEAWGMGRKLRARGGVRALLLLNYIIGAPWLVNGGHGASLRQHNVLFCC